MQTRTVLWWLSCWMISLNARGVTTLFIPPFSRHICARANNLRVSSSSSHISLQQQQSFVNRNTARSMTSRLENDNDVAAPYSSLESPLAKHGKRLPQASTSAFLFTAACVPVWALTVLPLSVVYQVGSALVRPIVGLGQSKKDATMTSAAKLDSGYVVDPSTVVPRSERQYDIVVLGATGFTGYLAARHLAKTYGGPKNASSVKWAIAGRSQSKLEKVKSDLAKELNMDDLLSLDTIVVDTSIAATLPKLVGQTRVVATTAGPYTLYGCSVVEFCAKFGTHYVDITGEVPWVKAMICQWQETAQSTGAVMIPFCGHGTKDTRASYRVRTTVFLRVLTLLFCCCYRLDPVGSFRLGAAIQTCRTRVKHDVGRLLGRTQGRGSRWYLCYRV